MFLKRVRRTLPIVLFIMSLCVFHGWAHARTFNPPTRSLSLLAQAQGRLQAVAELLWGGLSQMREKSGGSIDPNGTPGPTSGSTSGGGSTESGPSIDPNGKP
jgi:hypothetical protein